MEAFLAVNRQLDIIELAYNFSFIVHLALTRTCESAVLIKILHLSLAGITDKVVILDILGLLGEDKVVIDRSLHHILEDLVRLRSVV